MTNTKKFAKKEIQILKEISTESIIIPFEKEILALCEAFGQSGQSGGSAGYTASAISKAVYKLMLHKPISDITGHESEWGESLESSISKDINYKQNLRCSALFLETTHLSSGDVSRAYYLDAIVWKGEEDWDTFTGSVYYDDRHFELIKSSQYVKFPFVPKTFYIDVKKIPVTKEFAEQKKLVYYENDGKYYYNVIKDTNELKKVFDFYEKK